MLASPFFEETAFVSVPHHSTSAITGSSGAFQATDLQRQMRQPRPHTLTASPSTIERSCLRAPLASRKQQGALTLRQQSTCESVVLRAEIRLFMFVGLVPKSGRRSCFLFLIKQPFSVGRRGTVAPALHFIHFIPCSGGVHVESRL